MTRQWFEAEPLWFKRAVFYEIHVRGFYDGNGDGIGDFRGLTEKLDYLQWLGIDCIWLLPFYESPLRDGGYDISDFTRVHPDYGTVEDVQQLIDAAHARQVRVIADLVMNHTSIDHPGSSAPARRRGSPKRDWYVWSDTDERYRRRADHLHRHRDVELDLGSGRRRSTTGTASSPTSPISTTTTPRSRRRCSTCCVSGSTSGSTASGSTRSRTCSSARARTARTCPRPTPTCKRVRREIDECYPDRVLLAEANQWPADVVQYFGYGDECHMAFHFPVMPRMFMAMRREESTPIYEVLEQTPAIPESCQWGLFLRNHDELTLEMVTDDERDYMYSEYAKDPRMKLNLGIRRRLAPLLDNGRDEMQLMHAILFSLPGSPVLYYGDEIAMGDNVFLGDRDGVRTPMQWSGDRNGGFSRADFPQLYAPPLMDPVYGFQALNIEAQLRTPTSLLRWLHRLIALRQEHPVFGFGTYEPISPSNPKIFAHLRRFEDDLVLCVHNLARSAQAVELDLSAFEGRYPVELFGRARFPRIGELPYLLTLGARGFYWFELVADEEDGGG